MSPGNYLFWEPRFLSSPSGWDRVWGKVLRNKIGKVGIGASQSQFQLLLLFPSHAFSQTQAVGQTCVSSLLSDLWEGP